MKNTVLAGLSVVLICLPGLSCSSLKLSTQTSGAVLFYKEGKKFFIRQCEEMPRPKSRDDCKAKVGTVVGEVPEYDFTSRLKSSLFLTVEYTLAGDNQKVLDIVNKEDPAAVARKRNEALRVSRQLTYFIDAYEKDFPDQENAASYRKRLKSYLVLVADDAKLNPAIDDINDLIDEIVEQAFSKPTIEKIIFADSEQNFEFGVLITYVKKPSITSKFIQLDHKSPKKNGLLRFEIQETEITQGQWIEVMGYNRSSFKSPKICPKDFKEINGMKICPNHPVENVSWEDTQIFIRKINEASTEYTYRLPTDAEWSVAASGGQNTKYSFGDDVKQLSEYAWFYGNAGEMPMQVKTRKPNAFGLYDMHGNLWEWVQEESDEAILAARKAPHPSSLRIIRGGGWFNEAPLQASRSRDRVLSDHGCPGVGFRLTRTLKIKRK